MSRPGVERVAPHLAEQASPLIGAVIEGTQPGTVWVGDDAAVVVTRFGFVQWLGGRDAGLFRRLERALAGGDATLPNYLLWYAPPAAWLAWLRERQARERERLRWRFAGQPAAAAPAVPRGWQLRGIDAACIAAADVLGIHVERFWPGVDALLAQGLGICLVDDMGRVRACAYSACIAHGQAEVDIAVDAEARGRGLGHVVGRAFVEACLHRGILPAWDCFTANEASMRLAARLGFVPAQRYPLLSFNIPLGTSR